MTEACANCGTPTTEYTYDGEMYCSKTCVEIEKLRGKANKKLGQQFRDAVESAPPGSSIVLDEPNEDVRVSESFSDAMRDIRKNNVFVPVSDRSEERGRRLARETREASANGETVREIRRGLMWEAFREAWRRQSSMGELSGLDERTARSAFERWWANR